MPSSLTSSFASAAAGGNLENGVSRRDAAGGNEWSRNRPNGATQTFRRTSQAATLSRESSQPAPTSNSAGPYIPPHLNQSGAVRNGSTVDARYNKDQILGIYRSQKENGMLNRNLEQLFQGPWDHSLRNDLTQSKENKEQPGPEVCWNSANEGDPLGLIDMSDAERQMFSSSVNSPLKMSQNKEGGTNAGGTRKTSISNHHNAVYNTSSAIGTRPGVRRRETGDSFTGNGPLSPVEGKTFFRNEPNANTPPTLLRRRTDYMEEDVRLDNSESGARIDGDPETQTPFSSLRRIATGPLSTGLNGPGASPWSAAPGGSRSAFDSMGNFGNFAVGGSPAAQDADKRAGFGSGRGGSRFKDLLTKTSTEDMSPSVKEKSSFTMLEKLPEEAADPGHFRLRDVFKTRPNRSETNPYDEGMPRSGSAALSQDDQGIEQMGFSSFATNSGQADIHATPLGRRTNDPISPASTNPYQSPPGGRTEDDDGGHENPAQMSGHQPFAGGRRDVFSGTHDRNQPSFGAPRPGLGSTGNIPGWGPATFGGGTPGRSQNHVSSAFGDSIFSPMTELEPSSSTGLGGGIFGPGPIGTTGRPSRLGALFPPAMQEQMRTDSRNDAFDSSGESRDPFDGARRQESIRNLFEDGRPGEGSFSPQPGPGSQTPIGAPGVGQRDSGGPEQPAATTTTGRNSSGGSNNAVPATQQRQMVMPDRMRWIYRDPQGHVQGPWSGLEMHDWFKAGFFTADLRVKKVEDADYEALAQLVRRIGNSREPFLVPQIGVPHGPPTANPGNQWANTMGNNGGTQPPFANSFPSFGTTLTAEQQNALERRKQEEQYLMARQKEHLQQQQMYFKQMQNPPSTVHGLQHHSSAHSLHSQPSYGSIASPSGYQPPSSMQGPIQPPQSMHGFGPAPGPTPLQPGREDDLPGMMDKMSFNQRTGLPFGAGPIGTQPPNLVQGQASFQERVRLGSDGRQAEARAHEEAFLGQDGRNERLEEFNDLREQFDIGHGQIGGQSLPQPIGAQRSSEEPITSKGSASTVHQDSPTGLTASEAEELSLTQQVQRTAAAYEKAAAEEYNAQLPPVSISPLPAPAAQRNRQHVADALAAGSRSATQTPVETPTSSSVAPWADKAVEVPKGPSLKEIQEAEAKRAAEQEELLAANRRAQAEQERLAVAAALPPAPGLPSTSTWASSASPASPGPASSVWSKQGVKQSATAAAAPKKTLAQIQKEEEARKQRASAQAAAQAQAAAAYSNQAAAVAGKRYAELASKVAPATAPATGGAWTTVGSGGGKAKTPANVIASPTSTPRTVSSGNVHSITATAAAKRPAFQTTRTTSTSSQSKANEEFTKWVKAQLGNGLNSDINVDNFVQNLLMLPPEIEIIRDSVYASSQTIHGGRFAEEFVRRRKLADKGIVEPASDAGSPGPANDAKAGTGGWSEVAKKGPTATNKEENNAAAFKVVAKKKGRR